VHIRLLKVARVVRPRVVTCQDEKSAVELKFLLRGQRNAKRRDHGKKVETKIELPGDFAGVEGLGIDERPRRNSDAWGNPAGFLIK